MQVSSVLLTCSMRVIFVTWLGLAWLGGNWGGCWRIGELARGQATPFPLVSPGLARPAGGWDDRGLRVCSLRFLVHRVSGPWAPWSIFDPWNMTVQTFSYHIGKLEKQITVPDHEAIPKASQ